uniref:Reverse transcriptase domain-containing protein n=1 Tax=Schistosoma curassoni TaxID=6186 RepID=A0A183KS56_9TREM
LIQLTTNCGNINATIALHNQLVAAAIETAASRFSCVNNSETKNHGIEPKLTENPNKNVYVNTIDRIVSLLISVTCLIIKVKVNSKRLKRQADIPNINKGRLPFRSIINMDANEPIRIVTPVPRFA